MNENNGLITKIWGPSLWTGLHSITFGFPIKPSDEDKKNYQYFFRSIGHVLPCKYCRESYLKFIDEEDTLLEKFLDDRESLTYWLYLIHEKVNKKLGVNYEISFEDVKKRYESYRAKCNSIPSNKAKGCIVPLNKQDNSYKVLSVKECPVIKYEISKKFINYAYERGFDKDELKLLRNIKYHHDKKDDIWNNRNVYCRKLIEKMRKEEIKSIEEHGKYKGLPTIHETKLILNMCSNLSNDVLNELIDKINKL
jgi:hypothetical protein